MGLSKPVGGYASRTAAVVALKAEGLNDRTIAGRLGISVNSVSALRCCRSSRTEIRALENTVRNLDLTINPLVARRLRPDAVRRGLSVRALALLLIEAVADHGLADAVLDDTPEPRKTRPPSPTMTVPRAGVDTPEIAAEAIDAPRARWRQIVEEVCRKHGVTPEAALSDSRKAYLAAPRQEIQYRLAAETKLSLPQIGARVNRDHSTVLHGIRVHARRAQLPLPQRCSAPSPRAAARQNHEQEARHGQH